MTTATPILDLSPVLTSQGRGSHIMLPMALPSVGGMAIEPVTLLVVPVLYNGSNDVPWSGGPGHRSHTGIAVTGYPLRSVCLNSGQGGG